MKKSNILILMLTAASNASASDFSQLYVSSHPSMREPEDSSRFSILRESELSRSYVLLEDQVGDSIKNSSVLVEDPKYQSFHSPAASLDKESVSQILAPSKATKIEKATEEVKSAYQPFSSMFFNFRDKMATRSVYQEPPKSVQLAIEKMSVNPKEFALQNPSSHATAQNGSSSELSVELKEDEVESSKGVETSVHMQEIAHISSNPTRLSIKPPEQFNAFESEELESIYQDQESHFAPKREVQGNKIGIMERVERDIEKLISDGELSYDAARQDEAGYGRQFMLRALTKLAQKPEYAGWIDGVLAQYRDPEERILDDITFTSDASSNDSDDMELLALLDQVVDSGNNDDFDNLNQDMKVWDEQNDLSQWSQELPRANNQDNQQSQHNWYSIDEQQQTRATDNQRRMFGHGQSEQEYFYSIKSPSAGIDEQYSASNSNGLQNNHNALNNQRQFDEEEGCDPDLCHGGDPAQIIIEDSSDAEHEHDLSFNDNKRAVVMVSLDEDEEGNIDADLLKKDGPIKVRQDYEGDFPIDDPEKGFNKPLIGVSSSVIDKPLAIKNSDAQPVSLFESLDISDVGNHISTTHEVHIDCAKNVIQSNMSRFYTQNIQSVSTQDTHHSSVDMNAKSTKDQSSSKKLGVSSGDEAIEESRAVGVWVMPIASSSRQDAVNDKATGYHVHTSGIMVGIDKELQSNAMVGIAFTNVNSEVVFDKNAGRNDVNSSILSVYCNRMFTNNFFVQGLVNVGFNKNQQLDSAKKNGCGAELIGGYVLPINNQKISATCGLDFSYLNGSSTQQKDAATQQSTQNLRALVGLRYEIDKMLSYGVLVNPEMHFVARSNLNNKEIIPGGVDYNWQDPEYMNYGSVGTSYNVGLGLNSKVRSIQYGLIYDAFLGNKFQGQQLAVKLKVEF
ncbi:autotransporter outer membrane beta-barrel domain-containing protein [Rickettsiales endosymbiont of Paramecium tredecaurelia]|uniref:autotransporter outer membrane beta-barrel domain-containing protein n=1 Tax=Candidatus Sarmatiella mevalonica TaxID=2770581 RepID=UPI001922E0F0|nr:autotransporter outer membrane beta-barrel domain-containing protein [Candidatus Sarmatiella mevalonica]MBL3284918.1 autotransporter outer membrane beta-barrel domain-containing protein [Candidatus Sarmatiella mevalonica]